MLKIKLIRFGKRNQPHYRIVVQEARTKRDGKYTALLGHYAPTQQPKELKIDLDAYNEWIGKGAQPTETVAALAKRFESGNPFPEKPKKPSKKQRAKAAAAAEEAAAAKETKEAEKAAPAETETQAPAEESAPAAEAEAETPAKSEETPEAAE